MLLSSLNISSFKMYFFILLLNLNFQNKIINRGQFDLALKCLHSLIVFLLSGRDIVSFPKATTKNLAFLVNLTNNTAAVV